jgi:hypothetical protein
MIQTVGGWRYGSSAFRALARGGAFRLLRCSSFKQRLQLLPHMPLLGGCWLRAAMQQRPSSETPVGRVAVRWRLKDRYG